MKLAYNRYYLSINLFLFLPSLFLGFSSASFISRLGKLSRDRDGSTAGKALPLTQLGGLEVFWAAFSTCLRVSVSRSPDWKIYAGRGCLFSSSLLCLSQ